MIPGRNAMCATAHGWLAKVHLELIFTLR